MSVRSSRSIARQWRVPSRYIALKGVAALALVLLIAVRPGDPGLVLLAGVAALGTAALAARDLLAPVRLAADPAGVTVVTGLRTPRTVPWSSVDRLAVDVRQRFGLRSRLLEIDTGESLHLLSRYDLGAEPADALAELRELRAAAPPGA